MPIGMRPVTSTWSFVAMTTNGLGMKATIMISSIRRRPRDASALSSVSRCASWANCGSLSIANLQVGDCLCGGVEDALDGDAVNTTAELGDPCCEPCQRGLQRNARLECDARAGFDPAEHVPLVREHAATRCGHSVGTASSALALRDELLGAQ